MSNLFADAQLLQFWGGISGVTGGFHPSHCLLFLADPLHIKHSSSGTPASAISSALSSDSTISSAGENGAASLGLALLWEDSEAVSSSKLMYPSRSGFIVESTNSDGNVTTIGGKANSGQAPINQKICAP